jgi:dolichyl-phosphate beta-glucosyltransferase
LGCEDGEDSTLKSQTSNLKSLMPTPFLSVVIPAYNEAARIAHTLEQIVRYLEHQPYLSELIVVDDGSTDQTIRVVTDIFKRLERGILLVNDTNRGKGYSVRKGVLASTGEMVLFSDADLSTPIAELEKLLAALQQGHDIAIGSRGLKTSDVKVHQPFYREMMGKMFNVILRLLLLTPFHDTQCGFKCFQGVVARQLFALQTINHFSFDVEVLFLATLHGYKVAEVPVQWYNEPNTRVNALKDSTRMFKDAFKIRYNAWIGEYE